MKTDYAAHDTRYLQLRAEGAPGWDSVEVSCERELGWAPEGLELAHVKRVLELGCGAGNHTGWLVARGFEVTGVDISPTAIAWANERALVGAQFMVGDVTAGIEGEYDLIIDGHCLHCIIGEDRARLLEHVREAASSSRRCVAKSPCPRCRRASTQ